MTGAARCGAGFGLTAVGAGEARAEAAAGEQASERQTYQLHPIGTVEKGDDWVRARTSRTART